MTPDFISTDILWRTGLIVIPLAVLVALVCRFIPCRASTRHAMWLTVLVSLIALPLLPQIDLINHVILAKRDSNSASPTRGRSIAPVVKVR